MIKHNTLCLLLGSTIATTALADCDLVAGRKQYNKCVACHSPEPAVHLMGPSLFGLIGRKVGSMDEFAYSPAMEEVGFTWSQETLDTFLADPFSIVPGTSMPFGGIKNPDQRAALICYIRSLRKQPT